MSLRYRNILKNYYSKRDNARRKSSQINHDFVQSTSFEVVRNWHLRQSLCWKILCGVLGLALIYQIFGVIATYLEYQSMTATREKHAERDGIPFPSFTFCNMGKFFNPHKKMPNGKVLRQAGKADILRAWGMNPHPSFLRRFQTKIQNAWTNDSFVLHDLTQICLTPSIYQISGKINWKETNTIV